MFSSIVVRTDGSDTATQAVRRMVDCVIACPLISGHPAM